MLLVKVILARVYVSDTMPVMFKFNNKMDTVPVL